MKSGDTMALGVHQNALERVCGQRSRVAIIIPVYRNGRFLAPLFKSFKQNPQATPFEIVTVFDGDKKRPTPGRQVVFPENTGYPHANNVGVRHVSPSVEYLCLLNADTRVRGDWLDRMVDYMDKHTDVAVCGNKHLNPNGRIDSLGSEWDYENGNFRHVGRHCEHHSDEKLEAVERDMVTFACVLIRRSVWEKLGGFDEHFKKAYWEDADFCMRVRNAGHKIVCLMGSTIIHYCGSSNAVHGKHAANNRKIFHKRWVETGMVDKFAKQRGKHIHKGKVVACYIVLNEVEYIAASLESIYGFADRIVIVEGGNDFAVKAGWCGVDKHSTDGTIEAIQSFPDPANKIKLIQGQWKDKAEQRNIYVDELKDGDWMFLMDGDEVFSDMGLWRLSALMHRHDSITVAFHSFWNDFDTVGTGKWDEYRQAKIVRWRKGYHYRDHNCPSNAAGELIMQTRSALHVDEKLFHHYSWVKPLEKLRAKADYYTYQVGGVRKDYIDKVFLAWREDPKGVVKKYGTHPYGGGGVTKFLGKHPKPIQRRIERGEFAWIDTPNGDAK